MDTTWCHEDKCVEQNAKGVREFLPQDLRYYTNDKMVIDASVEYEWSITIIAD